MVKCNKHGQSNSDKAAHGGGGKANKKTKGKGGKGNKSINEFLAIGKVGPHLLKHRKRMEARRGKKQQQQENQQANISMPRKINNKKKDKRTMKGARASGPKPRPLKHRTDVMERVAAPGRSVDLFERGVFDDHDDNVVGRDPGVSKEIIVQYPRRGPTYGKKRKRATDDEMFPYCPWMEYRLYSSMPSIQVMLTQELHDFHDFLCPTHKEHQVRLFVYRRIKSLIQTLWPDANVVVFGSFETRLYLPSRYDL